MIIAGLVPGADNQRSEAENIECCDTDLIHMEVRQHYLNIDAVMSGADHQRNGAEDIEWCDTSLVHTRERSKNRNQT